MNRAKIIIISVIVLFSVAIAVSYGYSDDSSISDPTLSDTTEDQSALPADDTSVASYTFHSFPTIEQLIQDYNAIAEFPITIDMLHDSVTRNTLYASCNGVWITVFESMEELWVKFKIESATYDSYMPIYRDFLSALGCDVSADEFLDLWENEITTLGVMDDLTIDGLLCDYGDYPIEGGNFRYTGSIRQPLK